MAAPERSFPLGCWWWLAGKLSAGPSASGPGPLKSSCWQWNHWVLGSGAALWRVQPVSMTCVALRGDKSCATWWSTGGEKCRAGHGEGHLWSSWSSTLPYYSTILNFCIFSYFYHIAMSTKNKDNGSKLPDSQINCLLKASRGPWHQKSCSQ